MSKIEVKNIEGAAVSEAELSSDVFGIEPNVPVMHQAVVAYEASLRQGTHAVRNRHEVSGGGRKPYRQKGTGRARQGSIRAAQWTGGGVVFGPVPRSYAKKLNNKMAKLAMRSALSGKLADSELVVLDELKFDEIKTKNFVKVLDNLKVTGKSLVVLPEKDENVIMSARNIPACKTALTSTINVYDILDAKTLVLTQDAVKTIEEVYA